MILFISNRVAFLQLLLPFLAMFFILPATAGVPRDPADYFFEQSLGDYSEELQTARDEGKKGVFLFFEQEECPFCHRMKETILNQPEVQEYFKKHFLVFSVDIETTFEINDFQGNPTTPKKFFSKIARNRDATPVMAFFDLDGKLVVRYTGAASGVEEFMWLGEYASQGLYNKTSFTRYKRQKRKAQRAAASSQ